MKLDNNFEFLKKDLEICLKKIEEKQRQINLK